eukprot:4961694-Heterocapsa_arctica.AAC.1
MEILWPRSQDPIFVLVLLFRDLGERVLIQHTLGLPDRPGDRPLGKPERTVVADAVLDVPPLALIHCPCHDAAVAPPLVKRCPALA